MSGHLLQTINPEAAAQANSGWRPAGPSLTDAVAQDSGPELVPTAMPVVHDLPGIGSLVVYYLRDGDSRNMRTRFPALVLDQNLQAGTLSLIVTVDAGDLWRQDHVPARVAPEPGWEMVGGQGPLVAPHGFVEPPPSIDNEILKSLTVSLDDLAARIAVLEAKRGPGRPPNPKD